MPLRETLHEKPNINKKTESTKPFDINCKISEYNNFKRNVLYYKICSQDAN